MFCELARLLVVLGGTVAVGTDFRKGGFTDRITQVVERYRPRVHAPQDALRSYLAWPAWVTLDARQLDLRRERADVAECALPLGDDPATWRARGSAAWKARDSRVLAPAFTAMRRRMGRDCDVRIAFGGKLSGYLGLIPGVLEEIMLAVEQGQAIFLLGGLGGVARAVYDALVRGELPDALRLPAQHPEYRALLAGLQRDHPELYPENPLVQAERQLRELGLHGLEELNGLSPEENELLASSLNPLEIVDLLAQGLARIQSRLRRRRARGDSSSDNASG